MVDTLLLGVEGGSAPGVRSEFSTTSAKNTDVDGPRTVEHKA